MRIYTLGTSHGDSTPTRFNTSTAYEAADGTIYMVDCGAPAEALLRRKGLQMASVRAVFITHMHDDHVGGLSGFVKQAVKHSRLRREGFPLSLYFPEENKIAAFKGWFSAVHEPADHPILEYKGVDDGLIYEDDNLRVEAIRTKHCRTLGREEGDPCSFAYVLYFKVEDKTVLHTGDLRWNFEDYPAIAFERDFDACLCEATHYGPDTAIPFFMKSRFRRMIFIHIGDGWHRLPSTGWNVNDGERRLYETYKALPYPVEVAHDGDEFLI
ncbi:MAG: ribonuclease Z [Clostridia bacterium]|nr:ribonuclease Z [Clostridia bacterium]